MYWMITLFAAIVSSLAWYFSPPGNNLKLETLSLMYWGAALMWTIDGLFCVAEGEQFLTITADGAILGFLIVICGLGGWLVVLLCSDPRNVFKTSKSKPESAKSSLL